MNPKFFRNGIVMLALVVVALAVVVTLVTQTSNEPETSYTEFLGNVTAGKVTSIVQEGARLTVTPTTGAAYVVVVPGLLADALPQIQAAAAAGDVPMPQLTAKQPSDTSWLGLIITGLLPILIIGGFIFFMMRQAQGTNNQALSFGKSRARMFLGNKTVVTFADVAGVDEAKTELQEVVEFLKYPEKFNCPRCPHPARRPARRASRHRQDAAWPAPSPARPACRSSASRAPSSSRCSSASAPRACATSSIRPSATRPASSSWTRSTRSAASAAPASAAATTSASRP